MHVHAMHQVPCSAPGLIDDAFLVGLLVEAGSLAIGRTLAEAGLRGLDGLYLTSVKRSATVVHAVGPDFIIMRDDILFFAGELTKVRSVAQRFRLRMVTDAFEEDLPALMGSPRQLHAQQTVFQADQGSLEAACSLDAPFYVQASCVQSLCLRRPVSLQQV